MDENKKRKLGLVSATTMTIFSLASCFVGVYAWFLSHRSGVTTGDAFITSTLGGPICEVSFHEEATNDVITTGVPYIFKTDPCLTYTIDGAGTVTGPTYPTGGSAPSLGTYDQLESNPHQMLMLFKIREERPNDLTNLKIQTYTDTKEIPTTQVSNKYTDGSLVYQDTTSGAVLRELAETGNPMSNIIQFQTKGLETLTANTTSDTFSYYVDGTQYTTTSSVHTFSSSVYNLAGTTAGITEFTSSKKAFVTLNDSLYTYTMLPDPIYTYPGSGTITYIASVIQFSPDVLQYIFTLNLGNDITMNPDIDSLGFAWDWHISF